MKLQIASLEPDRLVLEANDEPLAGTYRRAEVAHVRGVATYREPIALAPDARLELHVASGADPIASDVFAVRAPCRFPSTSRSCRPRARITR